MDDFLSKTPDALTVKEKPMWFDEVMDDCKQALVTAVKHRGIFVPVFVKLGLTVAFVIYCIIAAVAVIVRFSDMTDSAMFWTEFLRRLPFISIMVLVTVLLLMLGSAFMAAGSFNLYKAAATDTKPNSSDFFTGVKKYFGKMFLGMLFLDLLFLILSPIILVLYLLFALIVGTLTAGWGLSFLSAWILIYLGTWRAIVVLEDKGPLSAIKASIRFGSSCFWGLFIIMFSFVVLLKYAVVAFGILPAILAGWFISGVVSTYFNLLILSTYKRKIQLDLNNLQE
jgi:hypothetical protein